MAVITLIFTFVGFVVVIIAVIVAAAAADAPLVIISIYIADAAAKANDCIFSRQHFVRYAKIEIASALAL